MEKEGKCTFPASGQLQLTHLQLPKASPLRTSAEKSPPWELRTQGEKQKDSAVLNCPVYLTATQPSDFNLGINPIPNLMTCPSAATPLKTPCPARLQVLSHLLQWLPQNMSGTWQSPPQTFSKWIKAPIISPFVTPTQVLRRTSEHQS